MPQVRWDVIFSGRVQGVGFRYTASRIAGAHPVSGWVRNEPDGSVRCVVEGDEPAVRRFIEEIRSAMSRNIREMRVDPLPATGEFGGFFEIRR
ncbi:MAG: acylphosphatase [Phycisphaeraceae bacterium]|nr:acylphosphatase [Phycisphaerales bacterium]QOJ18750.1 MAG: acylphosphatase [Phycisphaeraceae bacterium]